VKKHNQIIIAFILTFCLPASAFAQAATANQQTTHTLTIETATDQFLRRNLIVEAARLEVHAAEAEKIAARLRPRPGATISAENLRISGETHFNRLYETGLIVTQPFELGRQRSLRMEVAEKSVVIAEAQLTSVLSQRLFELKRTFYETILARIALALEEESRENFDELLRFSTARFQEGYIAESELIKVKLERFQINSTVSSASLALRQAKIRLLEMISDSEFSRTETLNVLGALDFKDVSIDLAELRQKALTNRADVKVAESELSRAESVSRLERAKGKGEVTPYVGYKRVGIDNTVLAGVTVPLPFGSRNQGGIARAEAEQRIAETNVRIIRNRTLAEVESAYRAFEASREQVRAFEAGILKQADESRDIALYAYREGATELITLIDAQRTRAEVRRNYNRALMDYYTSIFRLELATGMEIMK
jgi:outer membrane protein, heavy metal efflux system